VITEHTRVAEDGGERASRAWLSEEPLLHHAPVSVLQLSTEGLGLRRDVRGQHRHHAVVHVRQHRLAQ